jgi:hypothetical protein
MSAFPALTLGADLTYQAANVIDMATGTMVAGAGTLYRDKQALRAAIATSGLDANAAYTVWWVVFNNPPACSAGCGADDLFTPAVRAAAFYAAGFLAGSDGKANVTAQVESGALPTGLDILFGSGLERGNGLRAEIHMVIRSHGAPIVGMVADQISTFAGACAINPCADQQAVVFMPMN